VSELISGAEVEDRGDTLHARNIGMKMVRASESSHTLPCEVGMSAGIIARYVRPA